jgi:hypothetical protein
MTAPRPHRITYYTFEMDEPVETHRYTDENGNALIIASAHATLTNISRWPVARLNLRPDAHHQMVVHSAVAPDGTKGYILKQETPAGTLRLYSTVGTETTYCPADEWGVEENAFYPTLDDAKIAGGDIEANVKENNAFREMEARAVAAAAEIDGAGIRAWSRAAYEAACAAAGVDPADDRHVQTVAGHGGGDFSIGPHHRERVVWANLAYRRNDGIAAELVAAEASALARANEAAGSGTYTRAEYEGAWAAAGIDVPPLPDAAISRVMDDRFLSPFTAARDVLSELQSASALGSLPKTAATLSERRERGIAVELDERRAREREALAGQVLATDSQVDTIMRLLARHRGGGFFVGPTDRGGVANLTRDEASNYITSLTENY